MSQLKPSFIKQIRSAIEKSHFTLEDFSLEFPKSGRVLAKITFIHRPSYYLNLLEDVRREEIKIEEKYAMTARSHTIQETIFMVKAAPGNYKSETEYAIGNPGLFVEEVPKWCENIRVDLYALAPQTDPLESLRKKVQENLDSLVDKPEEFFTSDELWAVDRKFDHLYEEIARLQEDYALTKQQLAALKSDFDEFKNSARAFPKGMWAKITSNRLIRATGKIINTPEGRTFLFQEIRRALGFTDEVR